MSKFEDEKLVCESCGDEFDVLMNANNHKVRWVCESCFKHLEGVSFEDYPIKGGNNDIT